MKTAQFIEQQKVSSSSEGTRKRRGRGPDKKPRKMSPSSLENLKLGAPPWKPGECPNPGGLPGTDLAAKQAREFFERHPEGISPDMAEELKGFNAYAFNVLADRAYGKVANKNINEITGPEGGPITVKVEFVD